MMLFSSRLKNVIIIIDNNLNHSHSNAVPFSPLCADEHDGLTSGYGSDTFISLEST
jgi:hypothetical protein